MTETANMSYSFLSQTISMSPKPSKAHLRAMSVCVAAISMAGVDFCAHGQKTGSTNESIAVHASDFTLGQYSSAMDGARQLQLTLDPVGLAMPFGQSAIKQGTTAALLGPDP